MSRSVFNEGGLPTAWTGFSVKWYGELMANRDILSAALNTLIVAVISTAIAAVLGTLLAIGVEIRRRKGRFIETIIFAPMIIPDIVLAIALLSFFSLLDVTLGLHTVILSHVVFNLAFVCSVVRARLKTFDWSVVEASADLGASTPVTTFRRVVAAGAPGLRSSPAHFWLLRFRSMNSSSPSSPPAQGAIPSTLPMQIFAMIRFGVTPEINALATIRDDRSQSSPWHYHNVLNKRRSDRDNDRRTAFPATASSKHFGAVTGR